MLRIDVSLEHSIRICCVKSLQTWHFKKLSESPGKSPYSSCCSAERRRRKLWHVTYTYSLMKVWLAFTVKWNCGCAECRTRVDVRKQTLWHLKVQVLHHVADLAADSQTKVPSQRNTRSQGHRRGSVTVHDQPFMLGRRWWTFLERKYSMRRRGNGSWDHTAKTEFQKSINLWEAVGCQLWCSNQLTGARDHCGSLEAGMKFYMVLICIRVHRNLSYEWLPNGTVTVKTKNGFTSVDSL